MAAAYVHPEVLVDTAWVKQNLGKPGIKIVEVDVDTTKAYDAGHIRGAIGFNWKTQLQDQLARDILSKENFEKLMGGAGISPNDTVILYGDHHNWFAAYGFWLFKVYGHESVRLMNGGRTKWINEKEELTTEKPSYPAVLYRALETHFDLRALLPEILSAAKNRVANLVDVRSPDEYTGKVIAPSGMTETAQRGGHVPGAKNVPWSSAVNADGTFKTPDELRKIYLDQAKVEPARNTIAYCRTGERSSHTWFVLKYLLGFTRVQNYDGSWAEYGNLIGAPIEK